MPSIPSFGILITALIPLPANSFKPFHISRKPSLMPFQVPLNLLPISSNLPKIKSFKFLPNFFSVVLLISSHLSDRKSFDLFHVLDHLSWILSCVSLTFSASLDTLLCVSSLMPSQVFAVDFLRLSQVLPTFFLVSSTFLLRPFLRSSAISTIPLTNLRNFALSLYIKAKPRTTGLAKIRIFPIVVMTFLIVLPTFTKKSPTFLTPFLIVLTTLSVPFEIDFLKLSQPLDILLKVFFNHLIASPKPSLTDFAIPLQKSRNFLLCLYSSTNPATRPAIATAAIRNGLVITAILIALKLVTMLPAIVLTAALAALKPAITFVPMKYVANTEPIALMADLCLASS